MNSKKAKLDVMGEELVLWWEDKALKVEGYNVENEKIAFLLTWQSDITPGCWIYNLDEFGDRNLSMDSLINGVKLARHLIEHSSESVKETTTIHKLLYHLGVYSKDAKYRGMAALNADLTEREVGVLLGYQDKGLKYALCTRDIVASKTLEVLVREGFRENDLEMLIYLAKNTNLNKNSQELLMNSSIRGIRRILAHNKSLEEDILMGLLTFEESGEVVARRQGLTQALINEIMSGGNVELRVVYARKTQRKEDIAILLGDSNKFVRGYLAENPYIDERTKWVLADDCEEMVRKAISQRYDLSDKLRKYLKRKQETALGPLFEISTQEIERDFSI